MPRFALRFPFFILMLCLVIALIGTVTVISMPVDLFPDIDMPVVVVATFYNGCLLYTSSASFDPSRPTSTSRM